MYGASWSGREKPSKDRNVEEAKSWSQLIGGRCFRVQVSKILARELKKHG